MTPTRCVANAPCHVWWPLVRGAPRFGADARGGACLHRRRRPWRSHHGNAAARRFERLCERPEYTAGPGRFVVVVYQQRHARGGVDSSGGVREGGARRRGARGTVRGVDADCEDSAVACIKSKPNNHTVLVAGASERPRSKYLCRFSSTLCACRFPEAACS